MRASTISSFLAGALFPVLSLAALEIHDSNFVPDHVLVVTKLDLPTGCQSRQTIVVNGTSPGPAIHLLPGASSWIRVYNGMSDDNLTMHWHGLGQRMAPFADGTPQAAQWPIPPGHFFDYEIAVQKDDSGTYFYHSHVEVQALSCSGPLIVDDCGSSPYNYDDERIFHFQDFFKKSDQQMVGGVRGVPFRWSGETSGILLNGQGVSSGMTATTGARGGTRGFYGAGHSSPYGRAPRHRFVTRDNESTVDDTSDATTCSLPVIDIDPGKTYRFRFIGATGLSLLTMALEGHGNLTIVQVDGSEYNAPVSTGHLQMGAGQRFDVLFKSKTAQELAADGNKTTYFLQFETRDRPNPYRGYAVLRYAPDAMVPVPPTKPIFDLPMDVAHWLEYTFQPLYPETNRAPSAADVTRRVIIDCVQKTDISGRVVWELAGLSWTEFTYQSPLLIDIYQRGQAAIPNYDAALKNNGWDPATLSFPAKVGEVLEIVLQNTGSLARNSGFVETHPFHAHSKHYYDIGSGDGIYDADANNAKIEQLGYRPVKRDTTMLYRYQDHVTPGDADGWRAWRIRVDNPGVWLIHCHILGHMMMGMQTVWTVGSAADIMKTPVAESSGYFTYGGDVYGNKTHSPSYFAYFNGTSKCGPVGVNSNAANLTRRAF
ncbi:laccase-like protein [Bombardia bombarda]|uniref:Laccase-like protein n=1 Tax=Bombardia bombarda TaxID=252184 RepID=A0AA40BVX8_9PEZI|nr:laccase-like protein [Bombardia bombarda]